MLCTVVVLFQVLILNKNMPILGAAALYQGYSSRQSHTRLAESFSSLIDCLFASCNAYISHICDESSMQW